MTINQLSDSTIKQSNNVAINNQQSSIINQPLPMFKQFLKHTPFGISLILLFSAIAFLVVILPTFGNKTLIVRTGSMSPAIGVGDLIFVFPKQNYQVGDIIAFNEGGKSQTTITHRIASIKQENGQIFYQTKGDANKLADGAFVPKGNVLGSADYSIKGLGKLFAIVKTKNGFLLTAIFPAALVIILELVNIVNALKKPKAHAILPVTPTTPKAPKGLSFSRIILFYNSKIPHPPKNPKPPNLLNHPMGLHFQSASLKSLFASISEKINFKSLKPGAGMPYYATSFKALLPYAIVVILFTGTTWATTYSDSEVSPGNSFKAASSYPSPTPVNLIVSTGNLVSPSPGPSPTPVSGDVIINEINWVGSSLSTADEWIELRNTTAATINLSGWVIENLGESGSPNITITSGSIAPGGFFLIANNSESSSAINVSPEIVTTAISLNNDGEQLLLKDSNGNIIDTANDTGPWFSGSNSAPKKSMERILAGDGTSAASWQAALTHTNMDGSGATDEFGTPKATNGL